MTHKFEWPSLPDQEFISTLKFNRERLGAIADGSMPELRTIDFEFMPLAEVDSNITLLGDIETQLGVRSRHLTGTNHLDEASGGFLNIRKTMLGKQPAWLRVLSHVDDAGHHTFTSADISLDDPTPPDML